MLASSWKKPLNSPQELCRHPCSRGSACFSARAAGCSIQRAGRHGDWNRTGSRAQVTRLVAGWQRNRLSAVPEALPVAGPALCTPLHAGRRGTAGKAMCAARPLPACCGGRTTTMAMRTMRVWRGCRSPTCIRDFPEFNPWQGGLKRARCRRTIYPIQAGAELFSRWHAWHPWSA